MKLHIGIRHNATLYIFGLTQHAYYSPTHSSRLSYKLGMLLGSQFNLIPAARIKDTTTLPCIDTNGKTPDEIATEIENLTKTSHTIIMTDNVVTTPDDEKEYSR
jgi:hypothetical protein